MLTLIWILSMAYLVLIAYQSGSINEILQEWRDETLANDPDNTAAGFVALVIFLFAPIFLMIMGATLIWDETETHRQEFRDEQKKEKSDS